VSGAVHCVVHAVAYAWAAKAISAQTIFNVFDDDGGGDCISISEYITNRLFFSNDGLILFDQRLIWPFFHD
jgi:hypothetical protein